MTRPEASLLGAGTAVRIGGRATAIERRAGTDDKPIVRVQGCSTREGAEALRGEPLWVERAEAPALEADEYWAQDLVGCAVVDGSNVVGEVVRVLALPSCEALEVQPGDLLVPLVSDAVRSVDVQARRIDIDRAFVGD